MQTSFLKPIPHIIHQHAEESAILHNIRSRQVFAPHIKLHHLRRIDERIAAHLDGLAVAGDYGLKICEEALEDAGVGEVFAATVRAIEANDENRLDKLFALSNAVPKLQPGLTSAFNWVSAQFLKGVGAKLLNSNDSLKQRVAIDACVLHRVNPGGVLTSLVHHDDIVLRIRALRAAGEMARLDLRSQCEGYLADQDINCRFWAAWTAVLLGNRTNALHVLKQYAGSVNPLQQPALQLLLKVIAMTEAHNLLKRLAVDVANMRNLIVGTGIAGNPFYVPWLIKQMEDPKFARLAGESFSFITGLDLAYLDLERDAPEGAEAEPDEDIENDNVQMDEDDNLPWPDSAKIQAWWDSNGTNFVDDKRYFMGKLVSREHCMLVLKEGFQRQRIAAAQYLSLLDSKMTLFPTSVPAWRQERWLNI
ncbi:MAG: TIGR02270 family protein [Nitrosomonas sp.]